METVVKPGDHAMARKRLTTSPRLASGLFPPPRHPPAQAPAGPPRLTSAAAHSSATARSRPRTRWRRALPSAATKRADHRSGKGLQRRKLSASPGYAQFEPLSRSFSPSPGRLLLVGIAVA